MPTGVSTPRPGGLGRGVSEEGGRGVWVGASLAAERIECSFLLWQNSLFVAVKLCCGAELGV